MKSFKFGTEVSQGHTKRFQPNPTNGDWQVDNMQLMNLLSKADRG